MLLSSLSPREVNHLNNHYEGLLVCMLEKSHILSFRQKYNQPSQVSLYSYTEAFLIMVVTVAVNCTGNDQWYEETIYSANLCVFFSGNKVQKKYTLNVFPVVFCY